MAIPIKPKAIPPTPAQQAMWHGLQSVFQAAIISVCVGCGQYLVTGNISASGLLTVLCASFAGAGSMIYKSVASNPLLAQAALDTANEALSRIEQLAPWLAKDINTIQSVQKPAPQPITFPSAQQKQAQAQSGGGGGAPADYYTRNYNVVPRASVADMSTAGYPAVNPGQQSMVTNLNASATGTVPPYAGQQIQYTATNSVPPAMSFLQQQDQRTQQGG